MAMKKNNRDYIAQMNKGMKQKLSMLLIACLLFTGYHGLTISGRAEQEEKEQTNEISVSGTQVKVQLLGEDIRRAAKEAIEKGDRVEAAALQGYSGDEDLQKEYVEIFSSEKEVYEIPLDSISEGLSESLAEEEAGLQVFVERDAKDLERLVRKESKESLLLYDGNSQLSQLFPETKQEEAKSAVEKEQESGAEEAHASDSNIEKTERNTELTGSELITFLYKNKADHRISFQLSVDGNTYPKVVVSPKTQLFKSFLDKLKKEEKKPKAEAEEAEVKEPKEESEETKVASENTESNEPESSVSSVSLVSTEGSEETTVSENVTVETAMEASTEEEAIAEGTTEAEAGETEATVSETVAETAVETKATEVKEDKAIFEGFLQEVIEHYEEFLGELQTARFTQYSLNELGRKSQNVEIEGFATVEVFYDDEAFTDADGKVEEVVLEAKRLFKPEEEAEGEKLSEEQVKVLKEHSIYYDAASLDIRFVDKKDSTKEVEPKSPVSVRISIDKKALPEDASSDTIAIHHLVENNATKEIEKVDTVVHSNNSKNLVLTDDITNIDEVEKSTSTLKTEDDTKDETITKEFTVDSFSLYQITWNAKAPGGLCNAATYIRFHYVDKNFNEIGPTKRVDISAEGAKWHRDGNAQYLAPYIDPRTKEVKWGWFNYDGDERSRWYIDHNELGDKVYYDSSTKTGEAMKEFYGYDFLEVYPYNPKRDNMETDVHGINDYFTINWSYNPGKDFNEGIKRIDNTGYTLPTILNGTNTARFTWFTKDRGEKAIRLCETNDFYFVYDTNRKQADKRTIEDVEPRNEKYIKDNLDGTYELTLTGQIKSKNKQKLDIIFLLDSTQSMKLPFNKNFTEHSKNDYLNSGNNKKNITKRYIESLVYNLSQNSNYDLQYALVGFGGERKEEKIKSIVYAGNGNNLITKVSNDKGKQLEIIDTAWNDTTHVYGFTNLDTFKENLKNLPESNSEETGANYNAAIAGLNYLLKDQSANLMTNRITNNSGVLSDNGRRDGAKKIIIMLASTDPMYSYIMEDGVYDDTFLYSASLTDTELKKKLSKGYKPNRSAGIEFYTDFKKGDSYGNGQYFSRIALNQARGLLSTLDGYSAFYTVGIGNENNWKHLKELTQAHGHDQRTDTWALMGTKFIRAKSALAEGADSKVFDGSTAEKLEASFKELENKIAPKASNIKITDTLSENVTFVKDTELKAEVFKMQSNEVEPDGNALTKDDLKAMGLNEFILEKPSAALEQGGVIKLSTNPADFALPAGYEIRLTATIKPSVKAYEKLRNGQASQNEGDERTDLQDIFDKEGIDLPQEFSNDAMYGTSARKFGLFTNDEAKFTYKWKGQDKGKDYKRPIIKVKRADLKIEKTFIGLDKDLVNNSSGVTEFGKKIVQQLEFDILRSEKKSGTNTAKSFLTINFGDAQWADALNSSAISGNGVKVTVTIDGEDHVVTIRLVNEANKKPKLSITVDHLDSEKYDYHVWENINSIENDKAKAVSDPNDPQGPKYRYIGGVVRQGPKTIDNTACGIFTFENSYQKEEPKRTVTIKKNVNEFGATAFSPQAKNDVFDFYMALYNGSEAYDSTKTSTFFNNLSSEIKNKTHGTTKIKVKEQDGSIKEQWVIRFQLQHDTSLSLPMDPNVNFRLFELKKEDYEIATSGRDHDDIAPTLMEIDASTKYSYTKILSNMGQTITFNNPRITVVPTGLRGDLTPYLFSIFGFTLMAGAYFVINKKKRREI